MFQDDLEMRPSTHESVVSYAYSGQGNLATSTSTIVGTATAYQPYKNVDYLMKFNNQSMEDENTTKLLLMMPMVPRDKHAEIKFQNK